MPRGIDTKAILLPRAQTLRAQGKLYREIAIELGVSKSAVGEWFADPTGAKAHARRERYQGICVDCGKPTEGSGGFARAPLRCLRCSTRYVGAMQRAAYNAVWEKLWAEGLTTRQIGERLGISVASASSELSRRRREGAKLPHRRTPEQLARITAGSTERLAKARATYAATRASS